MKHPVRDLLLLTHFLLLIHETFKKIDMKNFFSSKTVWFNLLTGLCTVLALIKPDLLQAIGLPAASQTQVLTAAGTLSSIVNILLRTFSTSTPIGTTAKMLIFLFTLTVSTQVSAQVDTITKYSSVPAAGTYGSVSFNSSRSLNGVGGIVGYNRNFVFNPIRNTIVLKSLPSYADSTTAAQDSTIAIGSLYKLNNSNGIKIKVAGK